MPNQRGECGARRNRVGQQCDGYVSAGKPLTHNAGTNDSGHEKPCPKKFRSNAPGERKFHCKPILSISFLIASCAESGNGQRKEKRNSAVEDHKCISKRARDLLRRPSYRRRVRHAPMSGYRLPGPHGADFVRGVVAHGEHKIHSRRTGRGEFVPILAAKILHGHVRQLNLRQRLGPDAPRRDDSRR